MVDNGDTTLVKVTADLNITGKPAQFGRGVMVDVNTPHDGHAASTTSVSTVTVRTPATSRTTRRTR